MNRNDAARLERALVIGAVGRFGEAEIQDVPEPARRFLRAAIQPGTPRYRAVRLRMRGSIRLRAWLPFRARQVLNPHAGYVWTARVAGLIRGADCYANGHGSMDWRFVGRRLVHADGPDVSRSAMARGAAEAIWVPTSLLPRFGVRWTAETERDIRAEWTFDGHPFDCRYTVDEVGRIVSLTFERWGDPEGTGTWAFHPFGGTFTRHETFEGLTVPVAGRIGWFYGTDRWAEGEFFRFRLAELEPVH